MAAPRITIVTPSYNQVEYLEDCLNSVLSQAYPNLEYIVLDGGSTDGSREVIARHGNHLAYWRSEPDDGQAAALKEGFQCATGDILAWLNSDDLLAEGSLDRVAEAWDGCGGEVIVAGGCELIGPEGSGEVHFPSFQSDFGQVTEMQAEQILDMARHWFPGDYFYQPEVFFPRSAYERVGGIDPSYYYTMDFDLWVRFALARVPVIVLGSTLAMYREHGGQKTADKASLYSEMVKTANRYLEDAPLSPMRKKVLAASNRAALFPAVRNAWKAWRRFRERLRDG